MLYSCFYRSGNKNIEGFELLVQTQSMMDSFPFLWHFLKSFFKIWTLAPDAHLRASARRRKSLPLPIPHWPHSAETTQTWKCIKITYIDKLKTQGISGIFRQISGIELKIITMENFLFNQLKRKLSALKEPLQKTRHHSRCFIINNICLLRIVQPFTLLNVYWMKSLQKKVFIVLHLH